MHFACPHCHNPIEVLTTRDAEEILCPSCGSTFRLEADATLSWRSLKGKALGRFELQEPVGIGAFGTVYRARDPQLDRTVAIKVPRAGNLGDKEDLDRFLREGRSAARLRHPGIVPVHEVGLADGVPYLVSEFVEGPSLSDLLTARQPSAREAAEWVAAVADAIEYAHGQGVVHRDVKPSNILFDAEGRPHLMDFGLARREADEVTMTQDGQVLGTPAYMSPEQARGDAHRVDGRGDVYSLGVILYRLLTGELPFRGNTRMLLHQVLHDEPRAPRSLNDRIPRDLETIALKAMAKEPHRRYATAAEFAADLRRWLAGEPITATPVGFFVKALRWARRHPAATGLGIAIVVAGLALVAAGSFVVYNGRLQAAYRSESVARKAADRQRDLAVGARRVAQERLVLADYYLYLLRVNQADVAWRENQPERASELLEACPLGQRDWEWHYLDRLRHLTFREFTDNGIITAITYSPDGRRIASAGLNGKVKVWDVATGRVVLTLYGGGTSVVYSPDGRRIASAAPDRTVKVWDAATGQAALTLRGGGTSVVYSPDGRRIASAYDSAVKVWDAATGQAALTLRSDGGHAFYRCVAYSPDGRRIAASSADDTVKVWDAATGQVVLALRGPIDRGAWVNALVYSPDGRRIAATSADGTVRVWDAATGRVVLTLPGYDGPPMALAYSPDGRRIASADSDGTVKVWDAATGQVVLALRGIGSISGIAYSPDGRRIAAIGYPDETIRVWDIATGQGVLTLRVRNSRGVWDTFGKEAPRVRDHSARLMAVAYSPDGRRIASVDSDGTVKVWDVAAGQVALTLRGDAGYPKAVAYSPDGRRIASADSDGAVRVWDAATGQAALTLRSDGGYAHSGCVAYSPDGRRIAWADLSAVKVWDVTTGQVVLALRGPYFIESIAYSPDGRRMAAAGSDGTVIWDAATGQVALTLRSDGGHALSGCVAYSPDGRRIASAGSDGTAKVWDAATGQVALTLRGHAGRPMALAYSPDGRRIASAGLDGTVKVWDAATGQVALTLRGDAGPLMAVAYSPDGRRIAAAGLDGTVKVWDGTPVKTAGVAEHQALADRWWAAWQRREADECEYERRWFAAVWHLERLAEQAPEDVNLRHRLDRARFGYQREQDLQPRTLLELPQDVFAR